MQCQTQEGNLTNNQKLKIYLTLPEISATKIVKWDCDVYYSAKSRYDIIMGRDLLT